VTVAVASSIDIRERSYAVFEKPFIAGAAYVQIVGRLDVDQIKPKKKLGDKPYPEIREGASFLEATSTSAQELLSKAGTTVDRLNEVLSPENIASVGELLKNLSTVSGSFAKQDSSIQAALADLPGAVASFKQTFERLDGLSDKLGLIADELGPQDAATRKALAGKDQGELAKAVVEARAAMTKLNGASNELNKLLAENRRPILRFTETGLTELGLTIHELRELTANLNIIATKLERDPAGFIFSGKQGYTPK
jgi:phospholipid/cholesterol/gamma-HCH transport system substrate-binding protein